MIPVRVQSTRPMRRFRAGFSGEPGRYFPRLAPRVPAAALALAVLLQGGFVAAQEAADFFRGNCMSCHSIGGGRLTGPDLKNVEQRKDRVWLVKFLTNPKAMVDSGDPYAVKLQQEARGVVMPTLPGMTPARGGGAPGSRRC